MLLDGFHKVGSYICLATKLNARCGLFYALGQVLLFAHTTILPGIIPLFMLRVTKIFRFETAHAIFGYPGSCRNIHGHSYVLHVTVQRADQQVGYLPAPGFVIDFKQLKQCVQQAVVEKFDHCILLSEAYLHEHPELRLLPNLEVWEAEPTAENILLYVKDKLQATLPDDIRLHQLKLYETADSYAEWGG